MPRELEGFDSPTTLIEYRGIRAGERTAESKAPIKMPLRVRMPVRNLETKKFDPDVSVMKQAARRLDIPDHDWEKVREIPVFVLSDEVMGDGGVVYVERALFSARGRLCSSAACEDKARCLIKIGEYAKNKRIVELPQASEIDCTPECPLWVLPKDRGEKRSDCKWRAVVNVQLIDSPIFPSPARYRTTSSYSIRAMLTSLNFIKAATGGILAGIPLWMRQSHIDVRDAKGQTRRIPVVCFDFKGTLRELRAHALEERRSRHQLDQAANGDFEAKVVSHFDTDLGGGEVIDEEPEARPEDDAVVDSSRPSEEDLRLRSDIARLAKSLDFTPARMRALEEKHQGDLEAILDELTHLSGGGEFNPTPGEPGQEDDEGWDDDVFV